MDRPAALSMPGTDMLANTPVARTAPRAASPDALLPPAGALDALAGLALPAGAPGALPAPWDGGATETPGPPPPIRGVGIEVAGFAPGPPPAAAAPGAPGPPIRD